MNKRFIITLITLLVIGGAAGLAIFMTKGYTFSSIDHKLVGTGIISATSLPDGASVYIDGHLTTATNTTISQLSPKKYQVKIIKEGFIPWEKEVEVSEGLVSEIKATLFPALPTIYPLTYNGVSQATISPDGTQLAFTVPIIDDSHSRQKGGIWVWTMTNQPLTLARGAQPHQIVASTQALDFSKAKLSWSPDSKQLLVIMQEGDQEGEANTRNYLLSVSGLSSLNDLRDLTPNIASTLKEWADDQKTKDDAKILAISDLKIRQIASASAQIKPETVYWSPDETKFMITQSGEKKNDQPTKVYDLSLNKMGVRSNKEYTLPKALNYTWLSDSRHIILINEDKISVCEFDGTNEAVIFAGKFEQNLAFPWPDSSRLVIMTSFNTPTASKPNLFGINLK